MLENNNFDKIPVSFRKIPASLHWFLTRKCKPMITDVEKESLFCVD
jgi:hypothetical protein